MDGRSGTILFVAPLAAVVLKQEQEPAQVPLHDMAERSVKEMPDTLKAVTENRVVSNQLISSSRSCPFSRSFSCFLIVLVFVFVFVLVRSCVLFVFVFVFVLVLVLVLVLL